MAIETRDRRARIGFGIANVAVALFVAGGVYRFLPTRWWVVDLGAAVIALLLGASGVALLRRSAWAERLTRVAAGIVLILGLALFTAIVTTAGWIGGVYGQVGASGAIIFGLVAALVLPYVVVLPAVELAWIGPRAKPAAKEPAPLPKNEKRAPVLADAEPAHAGEDEELPTSAARPSASPKKPQKKRGKGSRR
jgi:hypothetical protein